jgi:hypothetical protein
VGSLIRRRLETLEIVDQRELLAEITAIRNSLTPSEDPQWSRQQVVFQLLWQVLGTPADESADERALRSEIKAVYPPRLSEPDLAGQRTER